jgi:hypothetical protein
MGILCRTLDIIVSGGRRKTHLICKLGLICLQIIESCLYMWTVLWKKTVYNKNIFAVSFNGDRGLVPPNLHGSECVMMQRSNERTYKPTLYCEARYISVTCSPLNSKLLHLQGKALSFYVQDPRLCHGSVQQRDGVTRSFIQNWVFAL